MKNIIVIIIAFSIIGCIQTNRPKSHPLEAKVVIEDTVEISKKESDTVSLLFLGDIMGHDTQIKAAYDSASSTYNYQSVFENLRPLFKSTDFTIGNLEVTLAGAPYKGYPRFSSPDELVIATKSSGINVLVTANNHSNDRKKEGIIRTINILDSLEIKHTGTFLNSAERDSTNLLILIKNSIRVGILNYTYGTNNKSNNLPAIVNKIDTLLMLEDIRASEKDSLDKLIIVLHWGKEYKSLPNQFQKKVALFLFSNGVDIIIGSHPHVIQPMSYWPATDSTQEKFIAYSLGNFVSNQRKPKTNGGALIKLQLVKNKEKTFIINKGYFLSWVRKSEEASKTTFEILLATTKNATKLNKDDSTSMATFIYDSHKLLTEHNVHVEPLLTTPNKIK